MARVKLQRKFTEDEIRCIMYEEGVYNFDVDEDDDGHILFETVSEDIVSTDIEKSSVDIEFVIKELSTGKFYSSILGQSQWYKQSEANADCEWYEVVPQQIVTTIYNYK